MNESATALRLVLTTFPDIEVARRTAAQLLDEQLAACVNLWPAAESHYNWEGSRQRAAEIPALIKTTVEMYARLESRLRQLHPYEVPEILALPVAQAWGPYADWVEATCSRACDG